MGARPPLTTTEETGVGLRHRGPSGPTFQMREKILAIGDDYWIEDVDGNKAYKVNGKAARIRETFVVEDASGGELAKIQEKKLSVRDKMTIEIGSTTATVRKRLVGIRDRFVIEIEGGEDLSAKGNFVDHEYEIERDGDTVATISKKWFRVRESYGVQLASAQEIPLILAITVCLDSMSRD